MNRFSIRYFYKVFNYIHRKVKETSTLEAWFIDYIYSKRDREGDM